MAATSATEKELNFLLIGKTGEGKSATGNTILGKRGLFRETSSTTSVTKSVTDKFGSFEEFTLKVVDCPGLMDTDKTRSEDREATAENMCVALGKCYGGVDAFIFVITRQRFTGEQRKTLEVLKQIFGDQYLKNLMVVVTGGDKFQEDMESDGHENMNFHEWCSEQRGDFKKLYDEFNDRFLLINNREKDQERMDAQRRELIQMADSLQNLNGRYTDTYFEEAKDLRDNLIVKENLPMLNETIQKTVGLLVTELLKLQTTPSHSQRESIQQSVNDLKKEITEKDKGTGLLNDLLSDIKKLETALPDIDELHRLAKKLEETRENKAGWSKYRTMFAGMTGVSAVALGCACAVAAVAAVAAAPFVLGAVGVGGLVAGAVFVVGATQTSKSAAEHENLSTSERQIQDKKDALESKLRNVTLDIKRK